MPARIFNISMDRVREEVKAKLIEYEAGMEHHPKESWR